MKKVNLLSVLVVAFMLVSFAASASGVRSQFKSYEIEKVNDLFMGKSVKAIWTVSYSAQEDPVTVVKRKTFEGIEYVVHSRHFQVSYALTHEGFGAKETRKSWSNVPKKISRAVINKEELAHQRIITPNKVSDETALGLIANYLPDLVNDGYSHLLN